ncbi:MAG: hypothetical protein COB85_00220 [Bacteroidetes bacterium]|nr:MAG: hypothetical protein COB85_00220 [Bacteroidota bacterium]
MVPSERINRFILMIRGKKIMLDIDLASIYGVTTKRLNEQVKRNRDRFPQDFMFQLTKAEKNEVVAYCDHLSRLKFSHVNPYAFTEHGAVMLSSVLNSSVAISASIQIVRAFVRLREIMAAHKDLAEKLNQVEKKHDRKFSIVFDALRQLMGPPSIKRKRIGYKMEQKK